MTRSILRRSAISALLAFGLTAGAAHAAYPDRPVTVVVAFAPGGMTDTVTRWLTTELSEKLGQTFIVDNRPGAAGQVGCACGIATLAGLGRDGPPTLASAATATVSRI